MGYKKLSEVLGEIAAISSADDREISGVELDSREIKPGDLFIAVNGTKVDGRDYIQAAIAKGAIAVLSELDCSDDNRDAPPGRLYKGEGYIPVISVPNLRKQIGVIAARFYNDPSLSMSVIGVTGTNGKTSCTHFLAKTLCALGIPCGVIGTLGAGFPDNLNSPLLNTTPDPVTLQKQLAELKNNGAKVVAIEVSSHSLDQDRVAGIRFSGAVFTNLTRDHLDYHLNMEHYYLAKKQLFFKPELKYGIINYADDYGKRLFEEVSALRQQQQGRGLEDMLQLYAFNPEIEKEIKNVTTHTPSSPGLTGGSKSKIKQQNTGFPLSTGNDSEQLPKNNNFPLSYCEKFNLNQNGFVAEINTPWGKKTLLSKRLFGKFNFSNLLAVFSVLAVMGVDIDRALAILAEIEPLPGRMQSFAAKADSGSRVTPLLVIDFAHTPDALEKALTALREHCVGNLWCVFGCGGDRDHGKRPLMGEIAERLSDYLVITDDNPRNEDPEKIVAEIKNGLARPGKAFIEHNREKAIKYTIDNAKPADIILLAGKGHERYQIVADNKIPFSDVEIVKKLLNL